jgi:hypothetical protein
LTQHPPRIGGGSERTQELKTFVQLAAPLVLIGALLSCTTATQSDEMVVEPSPVVKVEITEKSASRIRFLAKASWPNGCGSFSHVETRQNASDYSIKVFGKQPRDAICPQVIITFDAPVDFSISQAGSFTFRFWQSDLATLDTVITFP